MTRIAVFSDPHAGHVVGLTPPGWQTGDTTGLNGDFGKRRKAARVRAACWRRYVEILREMAPIHRTLFLGDGIDGNNSRDGGTELIEPDRMEQAKMTVAALDEIRRHAAKGYKIRGVYGTPYHTGQAEDFERMIASEAGFDGIGAHDWPEIEGVVFDIKHHVGSSSIPHGRGTAVLREMLWNELWHRQKHQPLGKVILRGHVHYSVGVWQPDFELGERWAFTCPALQAMGSKFGSRMCSGLVHWGMLFFDVEKGKVVGFHNRITLIHEQVAKTVKF